MKTIQKTIDRDAAFFDHIDLEPRAYLTAEVDYEPLEGHSFILENLEFAVIINGVEIDITDAVHQKLKRPVNANKWHRVKVAALEEITDEEVMAEFAPDDSDYSPYDRD